MAQETTKATRRRMAEDDALIFPWREVFQGSGIDVGAGDNPLPMKDCVPFDTPHGDAQFLSRYFPPDSQSYIHASQCLEHLPDPRAALRDWFTLLKPGGYLIFTVPDVGSYENFTYPSKYNPDHKASFSMIYKGSAFPQHFHLPTLLKEFNDVADILLLRYVEENYDWKRRGEDQTWLVDNGCELWNEAVLQKKK